MVGFRFAQPILRLRTSTAQQVLRFHRMQQTAAPARYYGANATRKMTGPALPWPDAKRKR
jgi:hypothetical protein